MNGFHARELANSCGLAVVFFTVAISAAAERLVPNGAEDEPLATAARITREGLMSGIAGDAETRDTALRRALQIAPDYTLARWHVGQIRVSDHWLAVEQAEQRRTGDAQLAEYRKLRDTVRGNPQRELALAKWCLRQGLRDAEQLHLRRVLASGASGSAERKQAMDRLGLRVYEGALLTRTEIEELKARTAEERKDQARWWPVVEKWRQAIESGPGRKRSYALEQLRAVKDPAAIATLESLLSPRSEELALAVVSVLGNMPEYEATQSLVRHAVDAPWNSVRDAVVQQLEGRPLHDFAPLLLRELVEPVQSRFYVNVGPDGLVRHQHELFREGPQEKHLLTDSYVGGPQAVNIRFKRSREVRLPGPAGQAARNELAKERQEQLLAAAAIRRMVLKQEAVRAIQIERYVANANAAVAQDNLRTFEVLERTSGEILTRSPTAWWEWWLDYNEVYREEKPTYTHQASRVDPYYVPWTSVTLMSCFPAGTQVRGETGLVAIERIQAGDRVLSQDVETGELAYKLVMQTTERPPSDLLRITLGDTTITTTKGHPLWVNDVGWRMAKRLEIGQQLHCVGDGQTIVGIEAAAPSQAYNLVVADFGTYFVGDPGVLVHDNTYRKPTTALTPGLLARDAAPHTDDVTVR